MLFLLGVTIIPALIFLAVFLEYVPHIIEYNWSGTECEYRIDSFLIPYLILTGYVTCKLLLLLPLLLSAFLLLC